jgi:hypothetical protein
MAAPVEKKVQAATAAGAVSGLALWCLGHWVFKSGVPDVVASWVYVAVPAVLTFAAGYLARHTSRAAPAPSAPPPAAGRAEKTLIPPPPPGQEAA